MHTICILLISLAVITVLPAPASGQPGFLSLNCGGSNYTDTNYTSLEWVSDESYTGHGRTATIQVPRENVSVPLQTLRFFPGGDGNNKYCYILPGLGEGTTYLIRASFFYGNYDGKSRPPSFVLILNYDIWISNVSTAPAGGATEPTVYELTYVSPRDSAFVCLARHPNSSETPFISTLELRPLDIGMYDRSNYTGALALGYGLQLVHRVNYGANTSQVVRYPNDRYDRIWDANTTGPILSTNSNEISVVKDPDTPPALVMATAITTKGLSNLSVVFEDFGGEGAFLINFKFAELSNLTTRSSNLIIPSSLNIAVPQLDAFGISVFIIIDSKEVFPSPFVATLVPSPNSPAGPLLNAIEVLKWSPSPLRTNGTLPADFNTIQNLQKSIDLVSYGDGDPCLPQNYSWSWVGCNSDSQPRIIEINLTNFNLSGEISGYISNLTALQKIYLADNNLSGSIPDLSSLTSLQVLDLQHNQLTGTIPSSLDQLPQLTQLNLDGNVDLCGPIPPLLLSKKINLTYSEDSHLCTNTNCTCPLSSSTTTHSIGTLFTGTISTKIVIYIISAFAFVYIISMLGMLILQRQRVKKFKEMRSNTPAKSTKEGENIIKDIPFATKHFTYEEVANATNQFSTKIGEGGFGQVFHGVFRNGQIVAVKTLADASRQGLKEFATEVAILSRLHHKNLVSLVGYCIETTYMLIYEYIPKGNLRELLYGEIESIDKPLNWRTRLQISLDAAQGLEYLHGDCDPTIIHRDVKSSNILLNDKMQAKVADFGLSRLKEADSSVSHVSTVNVVGTAGYLDPAYNATNQLTDKSDVYSFGIVLFEIICGRPPIDTFCSPPHIVDWVTPAIMQGNIGEIVDPALMNGYKKESMWKVIDVALGCVESDRSRRPAMSDVVRMLKEAAKIEMEYTSRSEDGSNSSLTSEGKPPTLPHMEPR